jgi:hypothetical protein
MCAVHREFVLACLHACIASRLLIKNKDYLIERHEGKTDGYTVSFVAI